MSLNRHEMIVFFHVANLKYSRWVFREIYRELDKSGLLRDATEVHLSLVGKSGFRFPEKDNFILHHSTDLAYGEFATLEILHQRAQNFPSANYLYIHTKGISKFWNKAIRDWRKYMTFFCVNEYRNAVKILGDYDACGVDLSPIPKTHFSGNFWWARGEYLKCLPSIASISKPGAEFTHSLRHNAEFWIGMGGGRLHSLHESGINVYQRHIHRFPRSKFASGNSRN